MPEHILPKRVYFTVFGALIVLALATTAIAYVDLGIFNTVIAMAIAVTKAVLVILFFMHVRYSSRLTWIVAGAGFAWLAILVALTLSDVLTRNWLIVPHAW